MRGLLTALLLFLVAVPARAALTSDRLDAVGVEQQVGTKLPLDLAFRDRQGHAAPLSTLLEGRPALLMFADYQCKMICGTALRVLAGLLAELAEESPGPYSVAVVGLDPKDGPAVARGALAQQFGADARPGTPTPLFLTGDAEAIHALADAAGYHYAYDEERGEFAHPVVLIALDSDGRIVRYLPAMGASGRDLWLALDDAGAAAGGLVQGLRTLCYRFDPASGVYTPIIAGIMPVACGATVLAIVAGLLFLVLRQRRRIAQEARTDAREAGSNA